MNWDNLKSYKCPTCCVSLKQEGEFHKCTNCSFVISDTKFVGIVNERYAGKSSRFIAPDEEENREALNNL